MMKKSYIAIILSCILAGLTACGNEQTVSSNTIELLEPATAITATEAVAYRNLYEAELYHTSVFPYVEEYAFEKAGDVEEFKVFPGQQVKAGEVLVYTNTDKIDEQIETLEEKISDMDEDFTEYKQDIDAELYEIRGEVGRLEEVVESLAEDEPAEYITGANGAKVVNPDYTKWEKEYGKYEGKYHTQSHNITIKETALKQKKEIYDLDRAYNVDKLNELKAERSKSILKAGIDGEVISIAQTEYGTYQAQADKAVVAVGDTSRKIVKCTYMKNTVISKAVEIYAVINGTHYELKHLPMETEEYLKLTEKGEKVYSEFEVLGDTSQVQPGDYAVIVVMKQKGENVLTIPKEAINQGSSVHYVYVVKDGQSERRDVVVGMNDGVYIEIVSGLELGEEVMVPEQLTYGEEVVTVGSGSCTDVMYKDSVLYYPSITDVNNPVTYGTAYYVEKHAKLYQHVEKGDVIATIRVTMDELELKKKQLKLQRLQERLQDVLAEDEPEKNADIIEEKQEEIAEYSQIVNDMLKDLQTVQITAPVSGIIVKVQNFSKDQEMKGNCLVAQIADENTCYLIADNSNQMIQYGKEVTITYENAEKQERIIPGEIVNSTTMGISSALQTDNLLITFPAEYLADMTATEDDKANAKNTRSVYTATVHVKEMNNVPVVPRDAVKQIYGRTYVHVIDENGNVKAQSFIAGGQDASHYWVIEGLTEGMKICLE